jgi:hypothetical protein
LKGKHGADLGAVENVQKQSLHDIVLVMSQGDLVASETVGKAKKTFSSLPGTEEARIFSILSAIGPHPDIGELHVKSEPFCFKEILQDLGPIGIKAKVNVNRQKFVMDGDAFASLMEKVKKREAVLPSGDPDQYAIPLLDQTVAVDRFSH